MEFKTGELILILQKEKQSLKSMLISARTLGYDSVDFLLSGSVFSTALERLSCHQ